MNHQTKGLQKFQIGWDHNTTNPTFVEPWARSSVFRAMDSMLPTTSLGQLLIESSAAGPYYPTYKPLQLELLATFPALADKHQN